MRVYAAGWSCRSWRGVSFERLCSLHAAVTFRRNAFLFCFLARGYCSDRKELRGEWEFFIASAARTRDGLSHMRLVYVMNDLRSLSPFASRAAAQLALFADWSISLFAKSACVDRLKTCDDSRLLFSAKWRIRSVSARVQLKFANCASKITAENCSDDIFERELVFFFNFQPFISTFVYWQRISTWKC